MYFVGSRPQRRGGVHVLFNNKKPGYSEENESLRKNREEAPQKAVDDFVLGKMQSYVGQFRTHKEA